MDLKFFSSPKTTVAAIAGIFVAVGYVVFTFFDGDPETMPAWEMVFGVLMPSIGLLFARDNNKSSEDVGLKKPPAP